MQISLLMQYEACKEILSNSFRRQGSLYLLLISKLREMGKSICMYIKTQLDKSISIATVYRILGVIAWNQVTQECEGLDK